MSLEAHTILSKDFSETLPVQPGQLIRSLERVPFSETTTRLEGDFRHAKLYAGSRSEPPNMADYIELGVIPDSRVDYHFTYRHVDGPETEELKWRMLSMDASLSWERQKGGDVTLASTVEQLRYRGSIEQLLFKAQTVQPSHATQCISGFVEYAVKLERVGYDLYAFDLNLPALSLKDTGASVKYADRAIRLYISDGTLLSDAQRLTTWFERFKVKTQR